MKYVHRSMRSFAGETGKINGDRGSSDGALMGLRRGWLLLLMLVCLCPAGGSLRAQVNLLPQGDFKNPGVKTEWAEGFNIPQNNEFRVVTENGKSWLRIENNDPSRQLDYVHAFVKVTPEIESLTISVRMRAT